MLPTVFLTTCRRPILASHGEDKDTNRTSTAQDCRLRRSLGENKSFKTFPRASDAHDGTELCLEETTSV